MTSRFRSIYPVAYAILAGGLVAGVLDITYAIVAYAATGVSPRVILQSVASGLLGKSAYSGGWPAALLGLAAHLTLTCIMAAVFVAAARRLALLRDQPLVAGALFGLAVFVVMNYVVVPLSAAVVQPPRGVFLAGGLLAHVFLVGIPIAFFARRVAA